MNILLVEDERSLSESVRRGLEREAYTVQQAFDGLAGLDLALNGSFDLAILDLSLPRLDGMSLLEQIRASDMNLPVLILTARDTVGDRVRGLDSGADDYLVKPFAFVELLARIRALLRRKAGDRSPVLRVADLEIDSIGREVRRGGVPVSLSTREFDVLEYLARNAGRVVTRQMIAEHAWGLDFDATSNVIDVYIRYLRRKLDEGGEPKLIRTFRGIGYQLRG